MKYSNSLFKGLVFSTFLLAAQMSFGQHPVIINDSLVVNQRLYAKEKLIVTSEAQFKQNIKVTGTSTLTGDVTADGATALNGSVGMANIGAASSVTTSSQFVIIQPDGQLKKARVTDLLLAMTAAPIDLNYCGANGGIAQWWAGLNKLFTACPDVKVGIRTDDPQFALHVVGTTYSQKFLAGNSGGSSNELINGFAPNNTYDLIKLGIKIGGLSEIVKFTITNDGEMSLTNTGADASVTINNGTGHAIVVTSNAGTKILQLEDNGLLRSRKIKVDLASWADYVFKPGYQLKSLNETEQYIQSQGHLPGVPSEDQLAKEGLDLAEMQKIQMEKIEELYLHVIQLEKKINALTTENQQLKKEISESNK